MIDSTTGGIAAGVLGLGFVLGFAALYALYRWVILPLRATLHTRREERVRAHDIKLEGNALARLQNMVGEPPNWVRFGLATMDQYGELPSYITGRFLTCSASDVMEYIQMERADRRGDAAVCAARTVRQLVPSL